MLAYRQLLSLSTSSVVMFGTGGLAIAEDLGTRPEPIQPQVIAATPQPNQGYLHIGTVPAPIAPAKLPETIVFSKPTTDIDPEPEAIANPNPLPLAQNSRDIQSVPTIPAETEPDVLLPPSLEADDPSETESTVEDANANNTAVQDATDAVEAVLEDAVEAETTEAETVEAEVSDIETEVEITDEAATEIDDGTGASPDITIGEDAQPEPEPEAEPEAAIATSNATSRINNIPEELRINQDLQNLLDPELDEDLIPPVEIQSVLTSNVVDLTLAEVIERALAENQDLEEAQLNFDRAEYQLREAIATEYPTLTNQTDLSLTETTGNELAAEANNADEAESVDSWNNRLELSYNLYTGGQRTGQIGAAETQLEIVKLDITRLTKETRLNAASTYYDLQSADAQTAIEESAVVDATQSLRDAELLERAGLGTKFDVLRAQVEVANAQQRLTLAYANQSTVRRQLAQLIDLESNLDPRAADAIDLAGRWNLSLEESILLAIQQREELRQFLLQREIDVFQEQIAVSTLRPQLSVFANYDLLDVFGDGISPSDGFSVGARVRWNLYDGGAAKARESQEQIDQLIAENRFRNQSDQIRLAVETAYYNLTASERNIETASIAVSLAEESLRLARMRFKAGVGTQTDVISAQSELTTARNNLEQAITDYNRAYAQLKREVSVGEELEQLSRRP